MVKSRDSGKKIFQFVIKCFLLVCLSSLLQNLAAGGKTLM